MVLQAVHVPAPGFRGKDKRVPPHRDLKAGKYVGAGQAQTHYRIFLDGLYFKSPRKPLLTAYWKPSMRSIQES